MQIDRAVQSLNRALLSSRERELSELEVLVLTGIWDDKSYRDLSTASSYEPTTIRNAASKLFQDIGKIADEQITKKNCKSAIARLVNRNIANIDLADAPTDVRPFCGRVAEITQLTEWLEIDRCKLVAMMGIGGIGKTAIAAKLGDSLAANFEFTIWRSLREAPPLSQLITELVQFLSRFTEIELPAQIDRQILTLLNYLRQHRCLVILDNIEAIMDAGKYAGNYRSSYQDYGILFQTLGTTPHQSCILITSRETPPEINELAAPNSPVRALLLEGIDRDAIDLLDRMGLTGDSAQLDRIVANCQGNPLYLRIIANTIFYNFKGNIADFLNSDRYTYSKISNIIKAQFDRLSTAERLIIYYLSTHREPMTVEAIEILLAPVRYTLSLAQTLVSLSQRSLVQITREGRYTLQNVVMEFVTDEAISEIVTEVIGGKDAFFLKI
jgi:NB-ARC domain